MAFNVGFYDMEKY